MIFLKLNDSISKNKKGIILMILSSVFVSIGQLFWKLYYEYGIFCIIIGFSLYVSGAFLMLTAYKFGRLSVLQPILSFNYIFSLLLANYVLSELISITKIVGIIIIIFGIFMICAGDK